MDQAMNALRTTLAAALILVGSVPAGAQSYQGISCDEVRLLSATERDYWSSRLKLSAAQRHLIYVTCYQNRFANRGHGSDFVNISR